MAGRTYCTLTFRDAYGKTTTRRYQSRDTNPSDAVCQALATKAQAYTALSVVDAVVTRSVDVTGITTAAEAKSSRQKDSSLVFEKSLLRDSGGGQFTFNMPEPKDALVDPDGTIDLTDAAITGWREEFDDGAGIPAIVGDWYVSDGEELVEDADPIAGFLNKR